MGVKEGYKQTEVGIIPKEWNVFNLDQIGKKNRPAIKAGPFGSMLTKDKYTKTGYKVYGQEQVIRGDVNYGDYFIDESLYRVLDSCSVLPLDVLFSLVGTFGKVLVIPLDAPKGVINPRLIRISPDQEVISSTYLKFLLGSKRVQESLSERIQGGTMGVLSATTLKSLPLATPPLPEQKAIAAALSDTDELIAGQEALVAKKRAIKQGAMQQLLTGRKRLPGFKGEWEETTLYAAAGKTRDNFNDGDWIEAEYLTSSGVRLIQTGNVGEGNFIDKANKKYVSFETFKSLNCKEVRVGDLLVCRLAEPAGRACIVPDLGEELMITSVDVSIFRPLNTTANKNFLLHLFSRNEWFHLIADRCGGSTRSRIARSVLGNIKIVLPSVFEQQAIAAVLSDMDAEIESLEVQLSKTRALKQGMMQELLTGRIRLVEPEKGAK